MYTHRDPNGDLIEDVINTAPPSEAEKTVSDADILGWFNANPGADDALIAQTMKEANVTPEQVARATSSNYDDVNARYLAAIAPPVQGGITDLLKTNVSAPVDTPTTAAPTVTTTPQASSFAQQYLDANPDVKAEYELFHQKDPATWTPESYVAYHYGNYGKNENRAGTEGISTSINTLKNQILGQNLTSKWSGEGYGSAEQNAADMARILTGIGITDIHDFGQVKKTVPTYDEEGNQTGTEEVTTYGNKKTGQAVPTTYSERQTGNAWGGTFAGKGNTGYRVQFAPDGTPVFYTTGASSNDLFNILSDNPVLNAVANAAAAYFGGPLGTAALQAAEGKDLKDIAKATALSYLGNQVAQGVTGMEGMADTFGDVGSKVIGNTAGQFVSSEGKIDPIQALLSGGINAGTNAILGEIPDFKALDPSIQKLVTKAVSSTLNGGQGLNLQDLVNTAFRSALDTMKSGGALTEEEQAQILQNRETKRLAKIEDTVLNQPASDDGSTQGILDLINQMYPEQVKGMSEADLAKFLEANLGETQGADYLATLLKSDGKPTADEGTVDVVGNKDAGSDSSATTGKTKNIGDQGNLVITGDRPKGNVTAVDNPEELVITGGRDADYVPGIRTKDIVSSIPDVITPDDITKLFPDLNINDILQVVTPPTKTVTPPTKTVTPTKTTDPLLTALGLGGSQQAPSQDPYAHIKSMEDLFGGDIAYKLRALGMPTNLASADIDALTKLLRG